MTLFVILRMPAGVRAVQFLLGTPRGQVWMESIRTPRSQSTGPPTEVQSTPRLLRKMYWAPKRRERGRSAQVNKQASTWITDLFSDEETQSFAPQHPPRACDTVRIAGDCDSDDPLIMALRRCLPAAYSNILLWRQGYCHAMTRKASTAQKPSDAWYAMPYTSTTMPSHE